MASTPGLGTPQKEGAEGSAGWQAIESSGVQYSDTSKSMSPTVRFQNDEVSSSGDELTTKVRKPYTITKQRERWTEEEHQKFLEALKMHGRAWRRIEEHIGTKTAVQIRSHAQKFFSKLEREASARGNTQDISIPPPRPKRKPSHPYPRKAGTTIQSASSANEEENRSPQAVSSASDRLSVRLNLDGTTRKNAAFTPYNAKPRPLQTKVNINMQEIKMDSSSSNSSPSSLKLFGKTVVVPTNESTLDGNAKGAFREFTSLKQETTTFEGHSADNPKLKDEKGSLPTITLKPQSKLKKAGIVFSDIPPAESDASALEGTGESNGNSPCQESHTGKQDSDEQLSSELDNNSNSLSRKHQGSTSNPVLGYPRHVPVQHVETTTTDNSNESTKYRPNAASLAHDFAAMSMLTGNCSSPNISGQMQNDVHNSLQPNILLPFPGVPGPFNRAFNNLENVRCVPGFFSPGSVPNGPLAPWPLTPSAALHHSAYAAATLAAAGFWPGLLSGTSGATVGDPQPSSSGVNGHILCDETSAAAAVTAATVAAASAWWTLHSAIPPPFLHPGIYSPIVAAMAAEAAAVAAAAAASGNSSAVCKTEPVMDARKQEQVTTTKVDNEVLDEMHSIPHAKDDRKLSMEQLDDCNECLPCPKSGSAEHFLQDSASCSDQNPTSCMEESCDAEMEIEKQNCKTEEKEHNTHYTNLHDGENRTNRKFMSSSGSNTPSSAEPETDTYLETNTEVIRGNDGDFESNEKGNRSSEAGIEDLLTKNIGGSKAERERNHLLANEEEITDDNRKHVHKDRHHSYGGDGVGRRSKSGCHLTDQWKAVSEEGRIAFQALFARDVLPQSFSPPKSIDGQEKTSKSTDASLYDNAKKKLITMSSNELQIDIQNVLLNNSKVDDVNIQREEWCVQATSSYTAALPAPEKKMQEFEATISDRSLEENGYRGTSLSPNENASKDFKPTKSPAISSFANFRSGRGFVPYQRCSMEVKKSRLHTRPTPNCQDDVREEKRICLEQEVKET